MWHKEYAELRDNILCQTGFSITFCGCPVTWCSKLQTEIALSSTEKEYIALSMATRDLLPLHHLLLDITTHSFIHLPLTTTTDTAHTATLQPSTFYEDNSACIILATTESNFKPHTKHISLKWHHFHDQVHNGILCIIKVATNDNQADIFMKPLLKIQMSDFEKVTNGLVIHSQHLSYEVGCTIP
jgi:hypothetical protein